MHLRPFEIVLIGVFGAAAIGALIFVTTYRHDDEKERALYGDKVEIWGTLEAQPFLELFSEIKKTNEGFRVVDYVEKSPDTFVSQFVDAVAEGRSPDLILIPHEMLAQLRSKLLPIEYKTLSERMFRDAYVDGAEIFMRTDGVYGIPLLVNPLVLYWNRDLFSSGGLATPPSTWEQMVSQVIPALTRKDPQFNITQSAISFGEYANISHPKQILSMLFLQAGSALVVEDGQYYKVNLDPVSGNGLPSGDAVLSFYTQFSNPTNANYTWNRSLKSDRYMFLGGQLGMYVGKADEYAEIARANPNLNFDVARIPQGSTATIKRDYGDFYAFAIPRASKNRVGAYTAAQLVASPQNAKMLSDSLTLAPALRSLLGAGSASPSGQVFYDSALIARGWLDPNPKGSDEVFRQMIQDVTSGKSRVSDAVRDATRRLELLFK